MFLPDSAITRSEISAVIWRIVHTDFHEGQFLYGSTWLDILDNVPVFSLDPDKFYTENGRVNYRGEETMTGIDVSSWQGTIDWNKVASDGIDFAIIRLGYRGYGTGAICLDSCFQQNIQGALDAGLKVGVYFYSQAINTDEAKEEADYVLSYLKDWNISLPVVFDWEIVGGSAARTYGLDTNTLNQCAAAFCGAMEDAGYQTMIYFNKYLGYRKYDLSQLTDAGFWYAEYTSKPTFYYDFKMWQYSSKGSVAGISGNVDMNLLFVDK